MADAPRTSVEPRRPIRRTNLLIIVGVLSVLAGALVYAARDVLTVPADETVEVVEVAKPPAADRPEAAVLGPTTETVAIESNLIEDDGKTLWASPTHGPPLDLAYLPPGVEIILALRPAELLANSDGEKVVAAMGPLWARVTESVEQVAGTKLGSIERLLVGWRIAQDGAYGATLVVTTKSPVKTEGDFFQPKRDQGRVTVIAPPSTLEEIRTLKGRVPPLSRDMERVLSLTDSSRDSTLILRPHALLNDANNLFQGELALLRAPLESFVGDDIAAASLSMHWDENFFLELVAVPTLDSSPEQMSNDLARQVKELPDRVEDFVLTLEVAPYGKRIVTRFPEMVRKLAAYTRHGFNRDGAVLRCYLPAVAGHNLLVGAELTLAEGQVEAASPAATPLAEANLTGLIAERLQKKTSLRFAREELEAALDMLGQDVGVKIVIRGPDLQLDGITRNQLFAIDMTDKSAEEILVEILRQANPDKLATGPADSRQKLVYVVGPEAIFITTRAKAAERGEPLPAVFRPSP